MYNNTPLKKPNFALHETPSTTSDNTRLRWTTLHLWTIAPHYVIHNMELHCLRPQKTKLHLSVSDETRKEQCTFSRRWEQARSFGEVRRWETVVFDKAHARVWRQVNFQIYFFHNKNCWTVWKLRCQNTDVVAWKTFRHATVQHTTQSREIQEPFWSKIKDGIIAQTCLHTKNNQILICKKMEERISNLLAWGKQA